MGGSARESEYQPSMQPPLLPQYLFSVSRTGDSPVPSADPPDGTERGIERNNAVFSHSSYTITPPGESPGGAGGSPALPSVGFRSPGMLQHSSRDALFVALALAHGLALIGLPSIPLIALGFWWNANTIAHNFIHRPFFRSRRLNALFSAVESVVLGVPQRLWRDRHLAHHGGRNWHWRWSRQLAWETGLVLSLAYGLAAGAPEFFLTVYLPGWLIGLALCQLQGHFEHEHGTTSHYGRLYNLLFFNDGYHVEHHARPSEDWR